MPSRLDTALAARLEALASARTIERLWERDVTVWGGTAATPELSDRLGWLDLPDAMAQPAEAIAAAAADLRAGVDRIVLCGMGGSSLAPEVLWRTFGPAAGCPHLCLLDSTHPDAVLAAAPDDRIARTLFLVASKSGSTIETASFEEYFWERTGHDGARFVAVTDPDTALERRARERGYREVFRSPANVGGRFSALSPFGLVPAALIGVNVADLLGRARDAASACRRPPADNPGARLGALMAEGARQGRDKLTLLLDERLEAFGLWVEQLVAESTGKAGTGVLPVVGESPDELGGAESDRVFAVRGLGAAAGAALRRAADRLAQVAGPVDAAWLDDPAGLGAEFFVWEFATAVAGVVLEVNPFDQPNVAESKTRTQQVLAAGTAPAPADPPAHVGAWLGGVARGDYVSVMAFVPPSTAHDARLDRLRRAIVGRTGAAVTVGYGPRFLHSTGQLHKGGPPRGHFLQIAPPAARDAAIPGAGYGFRRLIEAQADGDAAALRDRGRPVLRITDWDGLEREVGL